MAENSRKPIKSLSPEVELSIIQILNSGRNVKLSTAKDGKVAVYAVSVKKEYECVVTRE